MTVSELANYWLIKPDTIRYYVKIGLLKPSKNPHNGYKLFSEQEQNKLGFILQAKSLGFTLSDIKQIINQADSGLSPCPQVKEIMAKRLSETEAKLKKMQADFLHMKQALDSWQEQADCQPSGEQICHLIQNSFVEK
ncbi:MerR family transcriptional regulator [Catenovulum maritimum]|uniref:HTH merR-type domain-containing protein n=1 Tax=Catenovulum maritimum TaxID=1513271 RepID=A0A0J8JNT8_9ALTE|nr:MerR family transcriptional regulator [Catenovulum maritimum]KMT66301.1 hypothetical protein XM47_04740 [Catenovulum maritimum]